MSTNTPNYNLVKPQDTDSADLKVFVGQNMDLIDTALVNKVDNTTKASSTQLGLVKVGSGLSVDANGVLTASGGSGGGSSNLPTGIRYIRDTTNGNTVNANNYWVEIQALQNVTGTNIASGKTVTGSATPLAGTLALVTDGTIGSASGQYVSMVLGSQWVQVDLGAVYDIATVNVYRYYADGRSFHGVKTQVSDDGLRWYTIWDSGISGEYTETASGKSIPVDFNYLSLGPSAIKSSFLAKPSAILAVATSAGKVNFNNKDYDNLNDYDNVTNYRFTAKRAGLYQVSASIRTANTSTSAGIQLFLYKNGANTYQLGHAYSSTSIVTLSNSIPVFLNANDYLEIWAQSQTALTTTNGISTAGSWFAVTRLDD
jgi:hypothetical protein